MGNETLIFDIKRYAINDGPGIRVTVFFKGCKLNCEWCHNPESISREQEKMYSADKCIGSQACIEHCPNDALSLTPKGIVTDTALCALCGKCAQVCPTRAIEMSGMPMTVDEVMKEIKRETILMDQSEGGVTFSGGEPLLHHKFLIELLEACGAEGIHRCIDTSGFASKKVLEAVASRSEFFLYDLKLMDDQRHQKHTGVSNKKILENLKLLADMGKNIVIRVPLIKGVNDDQENIVEMAKFISNLDGSPPAVNILPFHNIAEKKYEKLGAAYDKGTMDEPDLARQLEIQEIFESFHIEASIGG